MRFTYFWPGWAIALSILIGISVTVFVYVRFHHQLQSHRRFLLIALRSVAIILLLSCLLAPVIIEKKDITPPTHLSVLVDTSQSMKLVDADTVSRLHQVNELLFSETSGFLQGLSARFKVHVYPFDTKLHQPLTDRENVLLTATGALTDIGEAVHQADAAWKGQQHAGIVLITDGAQNAGTFPLASVRALQTPIYAIGVGALSPPKDVQIQRVEVSPVAYTGHEHTVRVTIVQTGYAGQTTRLSLRQEHGEISPKRGSSNTLIDAITLTLTGKPSPSGKVIKSTKQVVELKLTPEAAGSFQYTVTLPTLDGELTAENNQQTFVLKVVKTKLNVFYLEGTPRWEYTFLKRALMRAMDVELTAAILSKRAPPDSALKRLAGYYPGGSRFPDTREELFTYDVLILGDVGAEQLTSEQQRFIIDFVETAGKTIFFLPSRGALGRDGLRNTELARLLPIEIPVTGCNVSEKEFRVQLTRVGAFHPMMQLRNSSERSAAVWHNLPALSRRFSSFKLRSGAIVLLEHSTIQPSLYDNRIADGARQVSPAASPRNTALSTRENEPVLIFQRVGLGKSLFIAAEGLWNWHFGEKERTIYPRFWAQSLRWMASATPADAQGLYLMTDAATYAVGDTVNVNAQVYSEIGFAQNLLQSGTTVQIEVIPPDGEPFPLRVEQTAADGTTESVDYTAQFEAQQKGIYRIRATAKASHGVSTSDETNITAQLQLAELEAPQRNEPLLKELATRTGGFYLDITDAERLSEKIADVQEPVFVNDERDIWAHPLLLISIVSMLGVEWFLRKRIGLI